MTIPDTPDEAASPLVSVILPHLNQVDFLRRSLEALSQQTYPSSRMEIIVVDNGSRESELMRLTALSEEFHFTLLNEHEPGPGPARNAGVLASNGAYLAFIDSDCIADRNWVSAAVHAMTANPGKAIGGDVRIHIENPNNWTTLEAYESVFAYRQEEYIAKAHYSGTGNLAMERSVYNTVGPFAGISVAEDYDWGNRAHTLGIDTVYEPGMVVYHPARTTFGELIVKWRRHIVHNFEEHIQAERPRFAWILRACAVFASGFLHIGKIITSRRIIGLSNRLKAAICLIAIRSYRAAYMVGVGLRPNARGKGPVWNR